jgi:SAM-dependent methyltransferase
MTVMPHTHRSVRERDHGGSVHNGSEVHLALLDRLASERDRYRQRNWYYHDQIERLARFYIPEGARVLEIGCSTGDLLASLRPSRGLGVDISPKQIHIARQKHSNLEFQVGDVGCLQLQEQFDYVVMSDVVGLLKDVWSALRGLRQVMTSTARLLLTCHNFLWEPILQAVGRLGLKMPVPELNWLGMADVANLLQLNGFEVVHQGTSTLLPAHIPLVSELANRLLAHAPGLRHFALIQYFLARPSWPTERLSQPMTCSVVVPCRNERGNIADIFKRVPELGAGTELIFVDGNSDDGTEEEIERRIEERPRVKLIHQGTGTGKGDAVRKGFAAATGEVLMVLDADLTVPPEDLPKFYQALAEGRGEFINGSRMVYPMETGAMRLLNILGNKFFSASFTLLLGMPVKDTLCGTKVLRREAYQRIAAGRSFFGDFDPFGDFDLLFGAAKCGLKLVEVPVRYRARSYGDTKIDRFRHGWLLLRMTALAFKKFQLAR